MIMLQVLASNAMKLALGAQVTERKDVEHAVEENSYLQASASSAAHHSTITWKLVDATAAI